MTEVDDRPYSERFATPKKGEYQFDKVPLDDPRVYAMIGSGRTQGCFQIESKLGKDWSRGIKPTDPDEISDLIALIRPGCLESGMTETYKEVKKGNQEVSYYHPALEPILKSTKGVLVYQEQTIRIAKDLAGFSEQEADGLRRAMGKKDVESMLKIQDVFVTKAKEYGVVTEDQAKEIFSWILKSARYNFNKCISGKEKILRYFNGKKNFKPTIEELYKIKNDIAYAKSTGHLDLYKKYKSQKHYGKAMSMCNDGRIRPNVIKDIRYQGKREIFLVTLENGATIKCTDNHKFPTPNGEKQLKDIKIGDSLFIKGEYELTDNRKYNFTGYTYEELKILKKGFKGRAGNKDDKNMFFVDGSSSKFEKARKSIEKICKDCKKTNCRIEIHHIDGNRSNNEMNNLEPLCSSCHKKKEYSAGRTKMGEKGYPVHLSKIVEIKSIGTEDVYDVEMDAPNHNFVVESGIVTCNSHSVSYGITTYNTTYAKVHYPTEFFCSYLMFSDLKPDPKEEIYTIVNEAKSFGISIVTPSVILLNKDFKITKPKEIAFGLYHIRDVGESAINRLLELGEKIKTPMGFLKNITEIGRKSAEALVKAGACDTWGIERMSLLKFINVVYGYSSKEADKNLNLKHLSKKELDYFDEHFNEIGENLMTSLIGMLNKIIEDKACMTKRVEVIRNKIEQCKNCGQDTNLVKSAWEKVYLGINISCSAADDIIADDGLTCKKIFDYEPENYKTEKFKVYCTIDKVHNKITGEKSKNPGQEYCYVDISDSTLALPGIVCWPEQYQKFKDSINEGALACVTGRWTRYKDSKQFTLLEIQEISA
jgi:hypothetical protein